jgi:hypothetical protein
MSAVVPIDELEALLEADYLDDFGELRGALEVLIAKHSPRPNPHTPGTYRWAREEQVRGKTVRRPAWDTETIPLGPEDDWDNEQFYHSDFTATDWEVVP